ncbi:MAG TPA: heavy metal translocating P-type ATPase [Actinomycetota bacterium]|nr:heavy metal translocating P-type ATPase [Actinomycetota bacterium]
MSDTVDRERLLLDIEGMTCASCVAKVERALSSVPGVDEATVNLATGVAVVRPAADPAPLADAVRRAGYLAQPHEGRTGPADRIRYGWRLAVAAALTAVVLAATFLFSGEPWSTEVAWALTTPVVFVAGWPFLRVAVRAARHRTTTMDTLIALGSLSAYGFSVWSVVAGMGHHYFDTAAVIVTLILLGRTLEGRARRAAGDAARLLLARGAAEAVLMEDGHERVVPVEEVRPGDVVVVRPGAKVPADGVVREGASWVDLSILTGESVPIDVGPGDEVVGSSINGHGRLVVLVTRTGEHSRLAEVRRLLEHAQGSKAPVQRLADRVSSVFVPAVLTLAALTFGGWLVAGADAGEALLHATAVVLIACPCALGLATPAAITTGAGRAAQLGALFADASVFERASRVDTVLLDKTGTVTRGAMTFATIVPAEGRDADEVLGLAAAVEAGSEHPVAAAIVEEARRRGVRVPDAAGHRVTPGSMAEALVGSDRVTIGRVGSLPEALDAEATRLARDGLTTVALRVEDHVVGLIAVEDAVREGSADAVRRLREAGLRVAIVTGDRRASAEAIAARVGIDEVLADVHPEGKVEEVDRLRRQGRRVAFVGDGLNDAPALALADVGIAIGSGTDVALAAADVRLLRTDLRAVVDVLGLARATYRVIGQNLVWAFGYNVVMIPLAVAGALTPAWAAMAMALSSLSVVLNALRLRRFGGRRNTGQDGRVVTPEPLTETG